MTEYFFLQLALSFVTGVIWISSITFIAERLGSRLGGAIAGIPATMVIALFFIGLAEGAAFAAESTTAIPLILGVNALFVVVYALFSKQGLPVSLAASLCFWFLLALLTAFTKFNSFTLSIALFLVMLLITYLFLEKGFNINSETKATVKFSKKQLLIRGLIAGLVIAFAVLMAHLGGPLIGGIFATFPALTVAMILIVHSNHGRDFTLALLKNFIIGGTLNVLAFVIVARYSYAHLGLTLGTIISFLASLLFTYINYNLINKKLK